ncbi:MAG: hypothetical protein K2I81_04175 [Alphaproteobacteria bacterium]|nr:hypothetical protein [Alphaproteobacteria bacterium]
MKEKTKKDIKEWFQILGLAAAGGIVVFHINSFFKPATPEKDMQSNGIERIVEKVDSIVPRDSITAMNKARAAQEMFFDGMRRGMPTR